MKKEADEIRDGLKRERRAHVAFLGHHGGD